MALSREKEAKGAEKTLDASDTKRDEGSPNRNRSIFEDGRVRKA